MASNTTLFKEVSEDQVLTIRKKNNPEIKFSEEYSIMWKLPQKSNDRKGSFIIDYKFDTIRPLKFDCFLKLKNNFEDYYNIVLELHGTHLIRYPWDFPKTMHVSLSLVDKNKRIGNTHKKVIKTLDRNILVIDFEDFIKEADLFNYNNSYLSNKQFTIYCKIYHGEERIPNETILIDDDDPTHCHQLKVLDNFEGLLDSGNFSDMKIIIDNKEFKVHKNILSAQSPVFEAMFKHDTLEQRNNSVKIIDINYETMEEVLRFIYAGKVNNIKEITQDIFVAAEKYQIDALKKICENELIESISVKNICKMLKLIDQYNSENLNEAVFDFIYNNRKDVNSAHNFDKTLYTLSNDLLRKIVKILMSK